MLVSFHTMIEDELRFVLPLTLMELPRRSDSSLESVLIEFRGFIRQDRFPLLYGISRVPWRLHYVAARAGRSPAREPKRFTNGMQNFNQKHAPIEERYMQM